jgi:hypothetical protein
MNGAQIHLLFNHVPVIGFPGAALALVWGWARKEESVKVFGAYLTTIVSVATTVAYFTGEDAEQVLKSLGEIPIQLIHLHEDTAEILFVVGLIAGFNALLVLPICRKWVTQIRGLKIQNVLFLCLLSLTVVLTAIAAVTAHQGGVIRHIEIR